MVEGLRWAVVDAGQASEHWDEWLSSFSDHHIRQCRAWAGLKSAAWEPIHTGLFNGPSPMALALCLKKRAPLGLAELVWINAGPAFQRARPVGQNLASLKGYVEGLKEQFGASNTLVRLNLEIPMDVEAQLVLRQAGFVRPLMPLGTSLTYWVDLTKDLDALREGFEKNWRHQLKQAEKAAPKIETGRDPALMRRYLPLHNALCERKNMPELKLDEGDLRLMAEELGERMTFFVLSVDGRDGCAGAVWTFGNKGWFALSAANEVGLKYNLPNAMYWHAITLLKAQGAKQFDLTGIDPRQGWGVFNFKRGLNAAPVELLGEWEWSPSDWTRRLFNLVLWWKRGSMPA
jgi:hypothetical protein